MGGCRHHSQPSRKALETIGSLFKGGEVGGYGFLGEGLAKNVVRCWIFSHPPNHSVTDSPCSEKWDGDFMGSFLFLRLRVRDDGRPGVGSDGDCFHGVSVVVLVLLFR